MMILPAAHFATSASDVTAKFVEEKSRVHMREDAPLINNLVE